MAELVAVAEYVSVNGVDLSAKGRSTQITRTRAAQDVTDWGSAGSTERLAGLRDWQCEVEFNADFAAGSVDATMHTAYESDTPVTVGFRIVNAAKSTTNPEYNGPAIVTSYRPLGNGVGEAARVQVTLMAAGALSRLTS